MEVLLTKSRGNSPLESIIKKKPNSDELMSIKSL